MGKYDFSRARESERRGYGRFRDGFWSNCSKRAAIPQQEAHFRT
jgi:hypothetical protein